MWYENADSKFLLSQEVRPRPHIGPTRHELARCSYLEKMRQRRDLEGRSDWRGRPAAMLNAILALF